MHEEKCTDVHLFATTNREMKVVILAVCIVVVNTFKTEQIISEWNDYKKIHNKSYEPEEESKRIDIYFKNKNNIIEHNTRFQNGEISFSVNVNKFTDMLETEVRSVMNGYKRKTTARTKNLYIDYGKVRDDSVDWRNVGIVTPVKNQGQCGSCWAFSAIGSLEGQQALKTGILVPLSEQNLVDCSGSEGNMGCNGGSMDGAFEYIITNGGIDTEASYPYNGQVSQCEYNSATIGATDAGIVDIPSGDEDALQSAVSNIGPISVGIDASHWSFHMYNGGVYDEPQCSSTQIDHGVLVVGYGTENGKDYWLVKNSWATSWGENGYIKMSRNSNNQCGIATQASYPTV